MLNFLLNSREWRDLDVFLSLYMINSFALAIYAHEQEPTTRQQVEYGNNNSHLSSNLEQQMMMMILGLDLIAPIIWVKSCAHRRISL